MAKVYSFFADGLEDYLTDDVTDQPDQTMGAYWRITRLP